MDFCRFKNNKKAKIFKKREAVIPLNLFYMLGVLKDTNTSLITNTLNFDDCIELFDNWPMTLYDMKHSMIKMMATVDA